MIRRRPNRWYLDRVNLTLALSPSGRRLSGLLCPGEYEVDLEGCTTPAQVLDWIVQVSKKTWATDLVIADLVRALDDLLDMQGTMCPFGQARHVNVKRALAGRRARAREAVPALSAEHVR
jgi:hypothetical protein